ncbi:MAG: urease accessory UreF family protein [Verrucomicrobiota bacterium]
MDWLELVLPFSDTASPVGGYAHSFGLEGLVQSGAVIGAEGLRRFLLREVKMTLLRVDLPVLNLAYQAAVEGKGSEVRRLDELARAMRPTREAREAGAKVGKAQWRLFEKNWAEKGGHDWRGEFVDFQAPVVAGVVFGLSGVPVEAGMRVLVFQTCSGIVQAALKLLPIGPLAGQELLREAMKETGLELEEVMLRGGDELGTFSPEWDVACARHETAEARLFLS